jgi:hypothetical protein
VRCILFFQSAFPPLQWALGICPCQ